MITIPTISELYNQVLADLETEFSVSIPLVGKNFLRALAAVQAGKLKLYYLAIGHLQKNIFVDTADPEASGGTLERFGRIKLGRNPFPARAAQYEIQVTGSIGAVIPASSTFKSNDNSLNPGKLYILDVDYTLVATTDFITVRALEGGLGSKLEVLNELTATAPIANVDRLAVVSSETIEPLSAETVEEYRRKTLEAYRLEAQGGAATDYRLWSADAQGVRQTYPYAKPGAENEINLYVEANAADSTDGKGTPSSAILTEVEDVVEFNPDTSLPIHERGRRPIGVHQIHFLPVTILDIDIEVTGTTGITSGIETTIFNAVKAEIDKVRPFVSAADILESKNDTLSVPKLISIILNAKPGIVLTGVVLKVNGVSQSTYTFINGDIPYLDTITYP